MHSVNFLSQLMASYNDYINAIEQAKAVLHSAGLYDESDFEEMKRRAEEESFETSIPFCDIFPCIVSEYIDSRQ